ncbi:MAG: hypothetical protein U5J96_19725 [Ignavibacteriaceae bacterium]|nr:hypothetical protein [Ignavibacteriaceae bacterium]
MKNWDGAAMGIVYKAEDTKLKREVAIKFLPHSFNVSEKDKEKLKAEAQIAAGINIIRTLRPFMLLKNLLMTLLL